MHAETPGFATPSARLQHTKPSANPYTLLEMGAASNSYAVRGGVVDIYRNQIGGMKRTAMTLNLKTHGGRDLTPAKLMLANREADMLMLSPEDQQRSRVYQMDIERATVVNEWGFAK